MSAESGSKRSAAFAGEAGRIRVLITVPHLRPTASPYRELMAVARYLPRDEFRPTVVSLREAGFPETGPLLERAGIDVFVARYRPRGYLPRHFLGSLRDRPVIERHGPFDIQHSFDFTYSPIEAILAKMSGRTFVFSQKNLVPGHGVLLRAKIALARRIVAISTPVEEFLFEKGAPRRKVEKIHLGIDAEDAAAPAPRPDGGARSRTVLCVGQVVRRKRHEDAIRAFALLAKDIPHLRLKIAGRTVEEDYERELRRLAAELNIAERVEFLGVRSDVARLMSEAECLLLCSEREALAWVLLEAMAAGLPVVASDVDGSSEVIAQGETGFLVPVGDIEGYARALSELLTRPDLRKSLAEGGRCAVIEKYSARAMVEKFAAMYRALAAGGRRMP